MEMYCTHSYYIKANKNFDNLQVKLKNNLIFYTHTINSLIIT